MLCFPSLTAYQRKALIENQVSFVVPGSQLCLPWLGMVLQERSQAPAKSVERLSWNAQLLTLLLLERKWENIRQADLAPLLGVSAMTVSRAVRELNQAELMRTEKSGRDIFLTPTAQGKELWEQAEPYLQNPVRRRIYVNKNTLSPDLPLSGLSALSVRTMLNPPAQSCYAMSGREYKAQNFPAVDPNWTDMEQCIELELWHYDPRLLCGDGAVSTLALALMYQDSEDERIQQATEKMMEEYRW
ncbi:MAG: MarR family transcriptional regulator [Clostridiales bacterium]|nr:MarR family transcriptional regulator [Clostridiales bacterium]